jgi:hypothetical protein
MLNLVDLAVGWVRVGYSASYMHHGFCHRPLDSAISPWILPPAPGFCHQPLDYGVPRASHVVKT